MRDGGFLLFAYLDMLPHTFFLFFFLFTDCMSTSVVDLSSLPLPQIYTNKRNGRNVYHFHCI